MGISAAPGSGFDPRSPAFAAANTACKHLLPKTGSIPAAPQITPGDEADYLKAAACMRSHGVPNFPEPVFQGNDVTFRSQTPIDTSSPAYQKTLVTCQELIPAGLPYSSSGSS